MKHYIERIDSDNLKQDFEQAIQKELNDVKTQTQNVVKEVQNNQSELQQTIDERIKTNETAVKQYDQTINKLTKGLTAMFFIIALVMVAFLALSPLGDLLGVHYFYEWINYILKTGHSVWRYFIVILYLVPYVLFSLLIYAILRAYKSI